MRNFIQGPFSHVMQNTVQNTQKERYLEVYYFWRGDSDSAARLTDSEKRPRYLEKKKTNRRKEERKELKMKIAIFDQMLSYLVKIIKVVMINI